MGEAFHTYQNIDTRVSLLRAPLGWVFLKFALLLSVFTLSYSPSIQAGQDFVLSDECIAAYGAVAFEDPNGNLFMTRQDFLDVAHRFKTNAEASAGYICDTCGRINATHDNNDNPVDCAGCGKSYDPKLGWRNFYAQDGTPLVPLGGLYTGKRPLAVAIAPDLKCGSCSSMMGTHITKCTHCGSEDLKPHGIKQAEDLVVTTKKPKKKERNNFRKDHRAKSGNKPPVWKESVAFEPGIVAKVKSTFREAEEVVNPRLTSPLRPKYRNLKLATVATITPLLVAAAVAVWLNTPEYVLEEDEELTAKVVGMYWSRELPVEKIKDGKYYPVKELFRYASGTVPTPEKPIVWPDPPPEARDRDNYRVKYEPEQEKCIIKLEVKGKVIHWPVDKDEYEQWRPNDTLKITRSKDGRITGRQYTGHDEE